MNTPDRFTAIDPLSLATVVGGDNVTPMEALAMSDQCPGVMDDVQDKLHMNKHGNRVILPKGTFKSCMALKKARHEGGGR